MQLNTYRLKKNVKILSNGSWQTRQDRNEDGKDRKQKKYFKKLKKYAFKRNYCYL